MILAATVASSELNVNEDHSGSKAVVMALKLVADRCKNNPGIQPNLDK